MNAQDDKDLIARMPRDFLEQIRVIFPDLQDEADTTTLRIGFKRMIQDRAKLKKDIERLETLVDHLNDVVARHKALVDHTRYY